MGEMTMQMEDMMKIIAPIAVIQLILMIVALVSCVRAHQTRGPKWMWVLIIIFGSLLGSVLYFLIGRRPEN